MPMQFFLTLVENSRGQLRKRLSFYARRRCAPKALCSKLRLKGRIVMILGKVTGSIVSTRKQENLIGSKFMVVEPLEKNKEKFIAVDMIGAGIGETVLVATGSAARVGCGMSEAPIDAAIVGIVDEGQEGVIK